MKFLLALFASLMLILHVSAQSDELNRFKTIIPPAPDVAALANFTSFPGTSFTGVPEIKVPLYNLKLKDLSIPVTLRYNASGIRVEDIPGSVGLGWSLDCGASISRVVNGSPDDRFIDDAYHCSPTNSAIRRTVGFLLGGMDSVMNFNVNETDERKKAVKLAMLNGEFCNSYDYNINYTTGYKIKADSNPDLFFLNIFGQSYRIFFRKDPATNQIKCVTTPYSNYRINFTLDNTLIQRPTYTSGYQISLGITSFDVTDAAGNNFKFDRKDSIRQYTLLGWASIYERGIDNWSDQPNNTYAYSSWHLSRVITASNDTVTLDYLTQQMQTPLKYDWRVRGYGGTELDYPSYETFQSRNDIVSNKIRTIETRDRKIEFIYNHNRQDVLNTNALTEIRISSKPAGNVVKKYVFDYNYFVASVSSPADIDKRLKLTKLTETSPDNTTNLPYEFTYYETPNLPSRNSAQQDLWGFYNGNGAVSLVPRLYVYPNRSVDKRFSFYPLTNVGGLQYFLDGSDRSTNPGTVYAGTLQQVKYPTGGWEQYIFEANQFWSENNTNEYAGGLRIQKIIKNDAINGTLEKTYSYKKGSSEESSGHLFSYPRYANIENTAFYYGSDDFASEVDPTSLNYYYRFTFRSTSPKFSVDDGLIIGYEAVTENSKNYNSNGSTLYKYSVAKDYMHETEDLNPCDSASEGECDGIFKRPENNIVRMVYSLGGTPPVLDCGLPYLANLEYSAPNQATPVKGNFFPFMPSTNYSWNRGLLLSQTSYDMFGKKVLEKEFKYSLADRDSIYYIPGLQISYTYNDYSKNTCRGGYPIRTLCNYSKYYSIANASKMMVRNIERVYVPGDDSKYLTAEKNYQYLPQNRLVSSIDEETSANEHITQQFYYPFNAPSLSTGTKNGLLAQNIKETVIEQETKRGALSVMKIANELSVNSLNGKYYTNKISSYKDGQLSKAIEVKSVDKYNNITEMEEEGVRISYIYNYKQSYPVAEVKNAAAADIAYTSFETDDNGGWDIFEGYTYTYSQAVTGKAYHGFQEEGFNYVMKSGLNPSKTYVLSFWYQGEELIIGGAGVVVSNKIKQAKAGWTYEQVEITGASNVYIAAPSYETSTIDELRLYPKSAQMKTYAYDPLIGIITTCDVSNQIVRYEYDELNRLKVIRDQSGNIAKAFNYSYAGQDNAAPQFFNTTQMVNFQKNNCDPGFVGSVVPYTVDAGLYTSATSVEDANIIARAAVATIGQTNANQKGTCAPVGVYVKVFLENSYYSNGDTYGDVVVRFFSDQACTTPISVSNLTVNLRETYTENATETTTINDFAITANGYFVKIRQQSFIYFYDSDIARFYQYFVRPGTGYAYTTQYTWP